MLTMSRIYFHDTENRTVYSLPAEPQICNKTDGSVFITTEWLITRADNYQIPPAYRWAFKTSQPQSETYPPKDAKEALGYFKTFKYPHFPEVTEEEFKRLHAGYETEAKNNKPPSA
jgi:hypothetical protein